MIWRDDDISRRTKIAQLASVDDYFQRFGVPHTIAVIAEGIDQHPTLVRLIQERGMAVQLHGWNHDDLTESVDALAKLPDAMRLIEQTFGIRPTVLYPPWNHTNATVEGVARTLGLRVSPVKISLDQWIRTAGDVREDTINFHYWHEPDVAQLEPALALYCQRGPRMKTTDYGPRIAPFDNYLRTRRDLVGAEVGVDVGAHAEALLRYCDIRHLSLIDPWPQAYQFGYCQGRLLAFWPRVTFLNRPSLEAAQAFPPASLDFVYIDQLHDGAVVAADLDVWWPILKVGGILGYRNYVAQSIPLTQAIDAFTHRHGDDCRPHVETGEIVLEKC